VRVKRPTPRPETPAERAAYLAMLRGAWPYCPPVREAPEAMRRRALARVGERGPR
jgi:hypothetical protein